MQKVWKNQKGFSLIELIIVIAILAIIAAIAVPNLIDNINNSRRKTDVANAKQIAQAIAQVYAEKPEYATTGITALPFVTTAGTPSDPQLIINLAIAKMQGATLKQKMNGNNFFVTVVATSGNIEVNTAASAGVMLFPTPAPPYSN